ncbi:MAG: hypothetical protein ACP5GR_03655 [Thermoplasmata archaeon]|jgi:hypothetical protein
MPKTCNNLIITWNKGYPYIIDIFFRILIFIFFLIFSISLILYYKTLIIGILLILIIIIFNILPSKSKNGLKTMKARLYDNCYISFSKSFTIWPDKIFFDEIKFIIFFKLENFNYYNKNMLLESENQGWQIIFIKNNNDVFWGPEFAINLNNNDLIFICAFYNLIKNKNLNYYIIKLKHEKLMDFIENVKINNIDKILNNYEKYDIKFCKK